MAVTLRLPSLLRPGRRLLVAAYALAFALAWWCEQREMFWLVVGAPAWESWIGAVAAWAGVLLVIARLDVPMADDPVPANLEPYDAAWLGGGAWRMAAVAMAMQVQRGAAVIEPDPRGTRERPLMRWRVTREDAPGDAVERALAGVAREGVVDVGAAHRALRALSRDAGRRLRAAGLAPSRNDIPALQLGALLACGVVLVLAAMRFLHTLDDGRLDSPSDLLLAMLAAGVLALFVMPPGRTTAAGRLALKPHHARAETASVARARLLGETPEAGRAAQAAAHPVGAMTLAVYAGSAVVDDPRFHGAWLVWPLHASTGAWSGAGQVRGLHDVDDNA